MLIQTTKAQVPLLAALLGVQNTALQSSAQGAKVDPQQAEKAHPQQAAKANLVPASAPLAEDIFTMRMRAAYRCYGAAHSQCTFYFAVSAQNEAAQTMQGAFAQEAAVSAVSNLPHGVLCVQGRNALYSGAMHDADELESFLQFLQVESFQSNSMLLPSWRPVPQYLLHLPAGEAVHVCAAPVDEHPDLWALAHSGVLTGIDPEMWYADACNRTNKRVADVRAIVVPPEMRARAQTAPPEISASAKEQASAAPPQYAATAGAYAIDKAGIYITAVETKEDYRGCGFGCTLVSSLARAYADKDKWLLCKPAQRGFYEQLGFVFSRPICAYYAPTTA